MSETSLPERKQVGTAGQFNEKGLAFALISGGILTTLAVAVAMLRFHRLAELPPGVDLGEAANGLDALRVLNGEHAVFFPEKLAGREGLIVYAIAAAFALWGRTELALRLPAALASAGAVFAVFWLGTILFGHDEKDKIAARWRGLAVGGVSAGLMAVSVSQTILGRMAFRTTFLPFLLCLCIATVWLGWKQRSLWHIVPAGICAGLLPYTYIPARLAPLLFLFFGLSFVLPFGSFTWERVRGELPRACLFSAVAGLVAAPILLYFVFHPESFVARGNEVSVLHPSRSRGDPLAALLVNSWEHLLAISIRGDPTWRNNYAGRPILNPVESVFFWLGVGIAIRNWRKRPAYRLIILWLGIMVIPALLASHAAPNTMRMIGAGPAVYLFIGIGLWEAFAFVRRPFSKWFSPSVGVFSGVAVGALIAAQGVSTYQTYFQKWAVAPEVYKAHQVEWAILARTLNEQPNTDREVYLLPYLLSEQYSFDYLYQGSAPAHVIRSSPPQHVGKQLESALTAAENSSVVKIVDWKDHIVWSQDGDDTLGTFLGKYGRYVDTQEYTDFQIHAYTDLLLDRPWTLYDFLEPLTVHYDGGISLLGFALGQGPEQLSSRRGFELKSGSSWWIAFQWQNAPGLEGVFSISLRLHDSEGRAVYQHDSILENSQPLTTNRWQPDEPVDTLHLLDLPADFSPGKYELRLVVYDFESQKPTVELGVWEPETLLTSLKISRIQ